MNCMSENISELMAALSKAQGKIQGASKDSVNPFFKSKYANLASIWEACRHELSSNGLAVVQTIQNNPEGGMTLLTTLGHSSGQWIRSAMPVILSKSDPQSLGSAITYYRRYSLAAIVGVTSDDDDDGEKAQANYRNQKPAYQEVNRKISKDQSQELFDLLSRCDVKYQLWLKEGIKKEFNADSLSELPADEYQRIKMAIIKNAKQKEPELALAEAK